MKTYIIYPKVGASCAIKSNKAPRVVEGAVVFSDEIGQPVAIFSITEVFGIWEEGSILPVPK